MSTRKKKEREREGYTVDRSIHYSARRRSILRANLPSLYSPFSPTVVQRRTPSPSPTPLPAAVPRQPLLPREVP